MRCRRRQLSETYDQLIANEMLDATRGIATYLTGVDEGAFYKDLRTIDAVCMNLVTHLGREP